jgi:hypothetical protein
MATDDDTPDLPNDKGLPAPVHVKRMTPAVEITQRKAEAPLPIIEIEDDAEFVASVLATAKSLRTIGSTADQVEKMVEAVVSKRHEARAEIMLRHIVKELAP